MNIDKETFYKIVAEKLERICNQKNITFEALELAAGLKKNRCQRLYSGKSSINSFEISKICDYLGISPNDLVP